MHLLSPGWWRRWTNICVLRTIIRSVKMHCYYTERHFCQAFNFLAFYQLNYFAQALIMFTPCLTLRYSLSEFVINWVPLKGCEVLLIMLSYLCLCWLYPQVLYNAVEVWQNNFYNVTLRPLRTAWTNFSWDHLHTLHSKQTQFDWSVCTS